MQNLLNNLFPARKNKEQADDLSPETWQKRLSTAALGRGEVRYAREMTSTNLVLREMAQSGAAHGSLCLCETQSAGRGRLGRSWHSPEGQGLWLSVLLRPCLPPERAPLITFCAALAMAKAVQDFGVDARIKWPNDLVSQGRKLCGILLEVSMAAEGVDYVVVGTGLNVRKGAYPPELAHQAASVEDFVAPPPRAEILLRYLAHLEDFIARLERDGLAGIAEEYHALSCTLGSRVNVTGAATLTGEAIAIGDSGALLVRTDDGEVHRVLAGDVSVRGVMGYV